MLSWNDACAVLALVALGGVTAAQTPRPADPRFPDGPGKTALFKMCGECHGPEDAVGQLKTRDEWSKTLDEMAANGARGTDEEWTQLLDYLDKHFSLIFVNQSDAKRLANALDVTAAVAESIVKYRENHGRFGTVEDLEKVPGLDARLVQARKDRLIF